jgi:hypothetical protein
MVIWRDRRELGGERLAEPRSGRRVRPQATWPLTCGALVADIASSVLPPRVLPAGQYDQRDGGSANRDQCHEAGGLSPSGMGCSARLVDQTLLPAPARAAGIITLQLPVPHCRFLARAAQRRDSGITVGAGSLPGQGMCGSRLPIGGRSPASGPGGGGRAGQTRRWPAVSRAGLSGSRQRCALWLPGARTGHFPPRARKDPQPAPLDAGSRTRGAGSCRSLSGGQRASVGCIVAFRRSGLPSL